MANNNHLKILGFGIATWNAWRARHPYIQADLSGIDL